MDVEIVRVVLVDDHRLLREAVGGLLALEPDLLVVGSAADASEALALLGRTRPDVVLMDLSMPGVDGIAATEALRRARPGLRVVILSATCSRHQVHQAFDAGACGYLLKDGSVGHLCDGIRSAARGGRPVAPLVAALGFE